MTEKPNNPVEKYKIVGLAFEMGYIIALPLIAFLLLGKYLDQKYHTDPFLKIAAVILALAVTSFWLTRRFTEILKGMRQDHNNKNQQD